MPLLCDDSMRSEILLGLVTSYFTILYILTTISLNMDTEYKIGRRLRLKKVMYFCLDFCVALSLCIYLCAVLPSHLELIAV